MIKYKIQYEEINGDWYYLIYTKSWGLDWRFHERWNSPESAGNRLKELTNNIAKDPDPEFYVIKDSK